MKNISLAFANKKNKLEASAIREAFLVQPLGVSSFHAWIILEKFISNAAPTLHTFDHILRLCSPLIGTVESKSLISFQDNGNFLVALTSSKKTERKKLLLSTMLKDHVGRGGTKQLRGIIRWECFVLSSILVIFLS